MCTAGGGRVLHNYSAPPIALFGGGYVRQASMHKYLSAAMCILCYAVRSECSIVCGAIVYMSACVCITCVQWLQFLGPTKPR